MNYQIKFRRNSKEKYWTVKQSNSLISFAMLLEGIFEKSDVDELEIRIKKIK